MAEHPSGAILKTEAIALRVRPFSRTSHVVSWLSPDHGLVTTVVKGACRPKSAFLGQYDLFQTCELLFYRRDHEGVHAIRECAPVNFRSALREDWRRVTTASYFCDLAFRVAQSGQESSALYEWLASALDACLEGAVTTAHVLKYELDLLRHAGFMPKLSTCPICHTTAQPWLKFGLESGRPLCPHMGVAHAREPAVTIHRDVMECLKKMAEPASTPDDAPEVSLGPGRFLGIFLSFHLDIPATPRRLAFELLETAPASLLGARGELK